MLDPHGTHPPRMAASAPGPASGFLSPAAAARPSVAPLPPEPGPTTELRRPLTLVAAHVQQLQSSLEAYKQHLDGMSTQISVFHGGWLI